MPYKERIGVRQSTPDQLTTFVVHTHGCDECGTPSRLDVCHYRGWLPFGNRKTMSINGKVFEIFGTHCTPPVPPEIEPVDQDNSDTIDAMALCVSCRKKLRAEEALAKG